MTANVNIIIAHKQNVLKLPTSMLRFTQVKQYQDSEKGFRIWALLINRVAPLDIKLGIFDGKYYEVLEENTAQIHKVLHYHEIITEMYSKKIQQKPKKCLHLYLVQEQWADATLINMNNILLQFENLYKIYCRW